VKLTTRLHLVPRLRKRGAIPPHPHVSMTCAWLSTGTLHLFFNFYHLKDYTDKLTRETKKIRISYAVPNVILCALANTERSDSNVKSRAEHRAVNKPFHETPKQIVLYSSSSSFAVTSYTIMWSTVTLRFLQQGGHP